MPGPEVWLRGALPGIQLPSMVIGLLFHAVESIDATSGQVRSSAAHRSTEDQSATGPPPGAAPRRATPRCIALCCREMISQSRRLSTLGIQAGFAAMLACASACADRRSELAVVYRGDAAAERGRVRVRIDSGSRAKVVVPAFPSAAHPEPVSNRGTLPIGVALLSTAGDTIARRELPAIGLAPRMTYTVGVGVGRRPAASRCNGAWVAAAIAGRADSLFASVTTIERAKEPPRCDD